MDHDSNGWKPGAFRAAVMGSVVLVLAAQVQAQAPNQAPAQPQSETQAPLPADAANKTVAAEWREQKLDFPFSAFTSYYTCTGLEDKMRVILLAFGARPDLKVRGLCDRAQNAPNRSAWVKLEFSSLVPAADPTTPGAVKAAWKEVRLAPHRPYEMGMGECELVEQMRDMLKKAFTLKDVSYNTSCVPKQVSVGDYSVTAQSLVPASTLQAAAH